jgi:hypothetical protein
MKKAEKKSNEEIGAEAAKLARGKLLEKIRRQKERRDKHEKEKVSGRNTKDSGGEIKRNRK